MTGMVVEAAILEIRQGLESQFPGRFGEAAGILESMPGYLSHELHRCMEDPGRFLLLVRWRCLEDHTEGFRGSLQYHRWKELLHPYYDPFPRVDHYECIHSTEERKDA